MKTRKPPTRRRAVRARRMMNAERRRERWIGTWWMLCYDLITGKRRGRWEAASMRRFRAERDRIKGTG